MTWTKFSVILSECTQGVTLAMHCFKEIGLFSGSMLMAMGVSVSTAYSRYVRQCLLIGSKLQLKQYSIVSVNEAYNRSQVNFIHPNKTCYK